MNILECFQSTWNVSRQPGKFTDNLERFQATWRVSRQPRKFLDNLESLHTAWKDSRQPELFPDSHKVSRQPGLFSDNLESFSKSFQTLTNSSYILYYKSCTRCMMYVHICRKKRFGLFFGWFFAIYACCLLKSASWRVLTFKTDHLKKYWHGWDTLPPFRQCQDCLTYWI